MVRLIINADDFGFNEGRTRAILEFFARGLISNTTLMVNMPFSEDAVRLALGSGVCEKVGLHLNVTEGSPLTEPIKMCEWFCDEDGRFNKFFHLSAKRRLMMPSRFVLPLRTEIEAKLRRYASLGLQEFHIDSHHHSHTDYVVSKELFPIAAEMGFRTARLSANLGAWSFGKRVYKRIYNHYLAGRFAHADIFSEISTVDAHWHELDGKTVEIMVHPIRCANGFCSDEPADVGEYETTAEELSEFLQRHKGEYELVSYNEI